MMVFCNFLEIKAETKKVVSFEILDSRENLGRLNFGDPGRKKYCSTRLCLLKHIC